MFSVRHFTHPQSIMEFIFRNPFSGYEYYNNFIPTLHPLYNAKTKCTYLPLMMTLSEKFSFQYPPHGRRRTSRQLNNTHCTTLLFKYSCKSVTIIMIF